jgi:hypothetical protein
VKSSAIAWRLVLAAVVAFSVLPAALAAIGSAVIVVNNVTGKTKQTEAGVALHVGIDVQQNETVETGTSSASKLVFQDNTQFEIGPLSQVVLDRFVFDPDPSKSKVALSLAKGAARFATGFLPKSDYEIRTPAATIGIRGTIFDVKVSANGTTTIFVETGTVLVTGGGVTVEVHAGESTIVLVGGVPGVPTTGTQLKEAEEIFYLLKQATVLPAVTTIITNSDISHSSNCVSPSQPGGRC